ncbi:MAG: tetratricopeptide repeat protein [Deltaproteobacteria bacterium]|nr:tetratricopeptide repeat protein [Deltaproteobacteria bacterium]
MKHNIRSAGFLSILTIVFGLFVLIGGCTSKEEKETNHLERAREYIEKNEFKEALTELNHAIKLDPENDDAYYELGEAYLKLKHGKKAFQSFAHAAAINPDNLDAQLKMGRLFLLDRKTEEARKKAESVLEKLPDNIEALVLLSGVQVQEKDIDSAVQTLNKAASIDPHHFKKYLSLARLLVIKGEFEQAEKTYLKALSLNPELRVSYIELAQLYEKKGEREKAETVLKKMIQALGAKHQNFYILASFYESTGQWDQAEKTYIEAMHHGPRKHITPLMNLGGYYARRNSYKKALETMQKAATINKDDLNIMTGIAQLHFDFKHTKDAESAVDQVLAKDGGYLPANLLKGRIYMLREDFDNALNRFDLVVKGRPRCAMGYYFRALSLIGKGELKPAKPDLLKAVELNPHLAKEARSILKNIEAPAASR